MDHRSSNPVRLSLAITTTPHRYRQALLREQTAAMGGLATILTHVTRYTVCTDTAGRGCWWNTVDALARTGGGATHHLVLQDDFLPCRDFLAALPVILARRPEHAVSLFSMRKAVHEARALGHAWRTSRNDVIGGTVVLPVGWIRPYLAWARAHFDPAYPHDDVRLGAWLIEHGHRVWNTTPSLLEHAGDGFSVMGHGNRNRVATWFLGDTSPLVFDWSVPETPHHDGSTGRQTAAALATIHAGHVVRHVARG